MERSQVGRSGDRGTGSVLVADHARRQSTAVRTSHTDGLVLTSLTVLRIARRPRSRCVVCPSVVYAPSQFVQITAEQLLREVRHSSIAGPSLIISRVGSRSSRPPVSRTQTARRGFRGVKRIPRPQAQGIRRASQAHARQRTSPRIVLFPSSPCAL